MVGVPVQRWGQTVEDLRLASIQSPHARTRERFQALFMIASGQANATTWALRIGRQDDTVLHWLHTYNAHGPEALTYRRTGGTAPLFLPSTPGNSPRWSGPPNRSTTALPATAGR